MPEYTYLIEAGEKMYPLVMEELFKVKSKSRQQDTTFKELDHWRIETLPQQLAERYAKNHELWLTKSELEKLMAWKLTKGTFRPTLKALIAKNERDFIEQTTKEGFKQLTEYGEKYGDDKELDEKKYTATIKQSMNKLCELKGVGPATASLLLSLLNKIPKLEHLAPPFFSDESFMYFIEKDKIKYNLKEYLTELLPIYLKINKVLKTDMNIIEKGSWSLKMMDMNLFNIKVPFEIDSQKITKFIDDDDDAADLKKVKLNGRKKNADANESEKPSDRDTHQSKRRKRS